MKLLLFSTAALVFVITAVSCANRPTPVMPGTPAFFWAAAQQAYQTGDYVRTDSNLSEISRTENEFTKRARPWHIAIAAGLAQGYKELGDAYAQGGKRNPALVSSFRRETQVLRGQAASASVTFTELVHLSTDLDKDAFTAVSFTRPAGPSELPPQIDKVSAGMWMPEAERAKLQGDVLQRRVRYTTARLLAGLAGQEQPKLFIEPPNKLAREKFLQTAAAMLLEQSELFSRAKLDQPKRLRMMCDEAVQALQSIPETPESRTLAIKIQTTVKKMGPT